MALIHEPHHRSSMQVIEAAIFGETMEERDERILKNHILKFYRNGFTIPQIAKGLELDLKYVQSVLEGNKEE